MKVNVRRVQREERKIVFSVNSTVRYYHNYLYAIALLNACQPKDFKSHSSSTCVYTSGREPTIFYMDVHASVCMCLCVCVCPCVCLSVYVYCSFSLRVCMCKSTAEGMSFLAPALPLILSSCRPLVTHHGGELLVADLAVAVQIGLPNHLVDFLLGQVLAQRRHDL